MDTRRLKPPVAPEIRALREQVAALTAELATVRETQDKTRGDLALVTADVDTLKRERPSAPVIERGPA